MKNTYKLLILFFTICFALFFISCGKTDRDKEWENKLKGYWIPINSDGSENKYIPHYIFSDENKGTSFLRGEYQYRDEFNWEIKRKDLTIYYEEPPSSMIEVTQDKYGVKTVMKINSFDDDTKVSVTMFTYQGYQRDFHLKKSVFSENEDNNNDTDNPDSL